MLKKYLFSLILFSAPLLSVDPATMSTQTLKEVIARYQQWAAALEKQTYASMGHNFKQRSQAPVNHRDRQIAQYQRHIARFEAELAKRTDR
jgi:hypothetical protein